MKKLFVLALVCGALAAGLSAFEVDPAAAQIVVPADSTGIVKFAAKELQRHLAMMTGKEIPITAKAAPGKYTFLFQKPANAKLKPEEAVWDVSPKQTLLYGDSNVAGNKINLKQILNYRSKTGDLSAVYAFLEQQLGFLFLAPGDKDTSFNPAAKLNLKEGKFSWDPGRLVQREMRYDYGSFRSNSKNNLVNMPKAYQERYQKDYATRDYETQLWLKKQRQGRSIAYGYGHAFTRWWAMYGKTNPEYFAMLNGVRKPRKAPDRVKMCVSNPDLVRKIVDLWKAKKPRPAYINVCENDSGDYCQCDNCRKLDIAPPGAKDWDKNLTDRYIHFANAVAKEAKKIDPNVIITFYAYSVYRFPPQKFRVDPNIVIGFVPSMMSIEKVQAQYEGWRKMGATKMFQRPNDQHINTGLPMGIEKRLFDHFQVGYKNGIIGTDYDSIHRFWDTAGIADYILARAHVYPERTFEEHFNEYCSAFGEAAPDVRSYFEYWRKEVFENRLLKNADAIREKGRYGNFRRGLMWDLAKYYYEKDFDVTGKILERGFKRRLNQNQKDRLAKLLLANYHCRLTYRAVAAGSQEKLQHGKTLLDFRVKNWDKLNMSFYNLYSIEGDFGDITGIKQANLLGSYDKGHTLRLYWYFMPDPKNELTKAEVWKQPFRPVYKWHSVRLDAPWEQQHNNSSLKPDVREMLKNYDGNAWYAFSLKVPQEWKGKEVALIFGAVDESAWVYVNGKLCGSHIYKEKDDWKKPFTIDITDAINWTSGGQKLFVRVEDNGGMGGIWRPVMLVCRDKKK